MINTFGIQVKCGIHERKMSKCSETYQWDFLLKLLSFAFLSVYFSLVAYDQKRICLCYGSPCRWLKHFCENCLMQRSHNFDNIFSFQAYLTINILRTTMVENGTTKFRANQLHDRTLHQNWNMKKVVKYCPLLYQ